ncbi:hypothetical protein VE00_00500 [Pseudogymnoascus sp. WSF 3629]|nr:hypothetical protein VE00_00500 [Pseudogymnoascus sp. WSF 3629]
MATHDLAIGQTVELADGRIGIIRYVGFPHFAAGEWVGVELEDDTGKNDGSVQGERYFDCDIGRGMFVRPQAAHVLEQAPPPPPKAAPVPKRTSRPSSVVAPPARRVGSVSDPAAGKRMSINASSPSPAARLGRPGSILRSPTKSPTKQLGSGTTSGASTPRTTTPSLGSRPTPGSVKPRQSLAGPGNRTSMGPPPIPTPRTSRQSISAAPGSRLASSAGRAAAGRPPSLAVPGGHQSISQRLGSGGSQVSSGQGSDSGRQGEDNDYSSGSDARSQALSPTSTSSKAISPVLTRTSAAAKPAAASPTSTIRSNTSQVTTRSTAGNSAATNREIEDLKTKLRLMEKKRMEDRDKIKGLDKIQAERDKFEGIIQKLQSKYQPQQQELTDLRKELKEAAAKFEDIENSQADHDVVLEMATLDREMAEETAEVLKHELEALKLKAEELELEVEVLKEENAELGGEMSEEDKASQGWIAMERNNERLREALLRLRDITQEQEAELKDQIKLLEEDVRDLSGVKEHYESAKAKLAQSEATVEDLRQQLDNALGAEDMIEDLTERNMSMSEQIEEMKVTIEDLESLKELNDELEVNHVETEKELQEDLDFKDTVINEQARRAAEQQDALSDMEYTLSRFRELVTSLQSDLDDMKASHALTETESEQLNSRSRAMMDLNLKLQVSASKTQMKTIELELRRLDAQEASDHLAIVQLFLPDGYQTEKDSVLALLRFKRVGYKANLLHGFVKERIGSHHRGHEDDIFAACDVLDKLVWVTAMCERFVNAISHCSTEQFAKYEGALYELEPVERALNAWIDGLRRDELKERQCASDLQRTIALMSHLAEIHISDGLESYAHDVHMRALVIQSHLDNTATALSSARALVQSHITATGEEDELAQHFTRKTDAIINSTRSAKVIVSKAVRSLEDLKSRSLSLTPDTLQNFEQCETATEELALFSRHIGMDLFTLLSEEGRSEPFTYTEVQSSIHRTTTAIFQSTESDIFSTYANKIRAATTHITDLAALASDLEMTQEFESAPAPWIVRSKELSSSGTIPVDAEEELRRLREDNHERARTVALRDQTLEESSVKIELLESRMRDATKKNERITQLETKIEEAKKREAELAESLEAQSKELVAMEQDRERWRKVAGENKIVEEADPATKAGKERAVATAREMDALKGEIEALQAAVRYLREDARRVKLSTVEPGNLDWLNEPLVKPKSADAHRKELVQTEGADVLFELVNLAAESRVFDLSTLPENRLAWRSAKSTPQWHIARQREEWEAWKSWNESTTKKAKALEPRRIVRSKRGLQIARVDLRLPTLEAKGVYGGEVEIVDPGQFEGFKENWGIV